MVSTLNMSLANKRFSVLRTWTRVSSERPNFQRRHVGLISCRETVYSAFENFNFPTLQKPNYAYDIEANGTKPVIVVPSNLWGLNSPLPSVIIPLVISRFEQFTQTKS